MEELTDTGINLAEPPEFLRNTITFDGEQVVGFTAITTTGEDGRAHPVGYMLVTVRGIYYFDLNGICYRSTALFSTVTITGVRPHHQREIR